MATTIKTKNSVTTTVVPTTLAQGELAVNIADKKMWVGNAATTPVQILGAGATNRAGGSNTQVQYNSSGDLAGSANMTFNGTGLTLANDASISGLTVGKGGGGLAGNTALGTSALGSNTNAVAITAIGYQAGFTMNPAAGTYNDTFVGYQSGYNNTTGYNNTFLGGASGYTTSTGASNTAVGFQSLYSNTTASNNTAVGYQAGYANTTGNTLVFVGFQAGYGNTTATRLVAIGTQALGGTNTGQYNTAVGNYVLSSNTSGFQNTGVGDYCLPANTTGYFNTAVGQGSMINNTTGNSNATLGNSSLTANTTGAANTAIGSGALQSNTTASNNTAVGYQTLYTNTTTTGNTAVGSQALYTNAANNSTALGYQAGYLNNTASNNTFIGYQAGYNTINNGSNQFFGLSSGYAVTTGYYHTILGAFQGNSGGLDIRTSNNYVVLSDGQGNVQQSSYFGGSTALAGATPKAGTGITFPATQSASTDANTLDDYEEGTWTPVLDRNSSSPSVTYVTQAGRYTKIGNQVTVSFGINWNANSGGAGSYRIAGLPFAIPSGNANYPCNIAIDLNGVTFPSGRTQVGFQAGASTSYLQFVSSGSGVITTGVDTIGSSGFIYASITYFV